MTLGGEIESLFGRWAPRNRAAAKAIESFTGSRWFYESEAFERLLTRIQVSANDLNAAQIRAAMAASDDAPSFGMPRTSLENGLFRIELNGALMKDVPCLFWFFDIAATSMRLAKEQIQTAAMDPKVEAILIAVDSPGGTADGLAALADAIFEARKLKPVHMFAQDLAASAAVWAGSQATRVSIGSTAVFGSIGVYTVIDDVSAAFAEAGVIRHVVRFGEHKGRIVEGAKVEQVALDKVQEEIDTFGQLFIEAVARGRGMSVEAVSKLATGEVWIGTDALATGLVDAVETEEQAIAALKQGHHSKPAPMPAPNHTAAPSAARGEVTMPKKAIMAKLQAGETLSAEEIAFLSEHTAEPAPAAQPKKAEPNALSAPSLSAELAAEKARTEKLEAQVANLLAKDKRDRYLAEASKLKHVPGLSVEEIADQLMLADDANKPEMAAKLRQHLATVNATMESSRFFDTFGTHVKGSDSAAGQIAAKTAEIMAKEPDLTEFQARSKAFEQNPELAYELRRGGKD